MIVFRLRPDCSIVTGMPGTSFIRPSLSSSLSSIAFLGKILALRGRTSCNPGSWLSYWYRLTVASLIERFISSTCPMVHGWLSLVKRCSVLFSRQRMANMCVTSCVVGPFAWTNAIEP
jgi:hypothetical protein